MRPRKRFIGGWHCLFVIIAAATVVTTFSSDASNDGSVECGVDEFTNSSCSSVDPPNSSILEQRRQRQHQLSLSKVQNKEKWNWDPADSNHPCNVPRLSRAEVREKFGPEGLPKLHHEPLIIYPGDGDDDNNPNAAAFVTMTSRPNLASNFPPGFEVTLSGSDSLSSHRRTIPIDQYISEMLTANDGTGETFPDQLGNETWYLFGETFSPEWKTFLSSYVLPPSQACSYLDRVTGMVALAFGIGNRGSGVQWHVHGPGFSETIHGRKHWILYPPHLEPDYDKNYASRHWMEYVYPHLADFKPVIDDDDRHDGVEIGGGPSKGRKGGPSVNKPWECTLHPGEMIYFPDMWHHATVNLDPYTVFVSSFTTEHE